MIAITYYYPSHVEACFQHKRFLCQTWKKGHVQQQSNVAIRHYEYIQINARQYSM